MALLDPLKVCRLCLVNNDVDIPIFEGKGNLRQIFMKISTCLPVNVAKEDKLSQKICNGCLDKVEEFFKYWNSTADAEKQLLRYLKNVEQSDEENDDYFRETVEEDTEQDVESIEEKEICNIEKGLEGHNVADKSKGIMVELKVEPDFPFIEDQDELSEAPDSPEEVTKKLRKRKRKVNNAVPRRNGPYKCDQCDLIFEYQREVREHKKDAHLISEPKPKCKECGLEFKNRQTLYYHTLRKHGPTNQFVCHECGKQFNVKNGLYLHIELCHKKDEGAICQFCNRQLRNKFALKRHIAAMHNIRPYPCSKCKKRLATLESLEAHEKLHDDPQRNEVECEICKKKFRCNNTLKSHMTIHTGVKPYVCKVCGKAFRRQHIYKQHLLLHTDAKPYFCDVCGDNFKQKPSLINHRKKHGPLPPLPAQSVDNVIKDLLDNVNPESAYYTNSQPFQ